MMNKTKGRKPEVKQVQRAKKSRLLETSRTDCTTVLFSGRRYYHTLPGAAMVHTGHTGAVVSVSQ